MKDYINDLTKQIWESSEVKWSPGNSEKTYGEAVYEWWDKLLTENPSDRNILLLKNQLRALEVRVDDLEKDHTVRLQNIFEGQESELSVLELIELYKEAIHYLNKLKEQYVKPVLTLEERVEKWVKGYTPNSPNKEAYNKYLCFIAKACSNDIKDTNDKDLLRKLETEYGSPLKLQDRRLLETISAFKRDFHQIK